MASGDGSGAKDYIEGWAKDGKPLDRIMQSSQLQEIQQEIIKEEADVNKQLTKEQGDLARAQADLTSCNEEYVKQEKHLEMLKSQQKVELDIDQQAQIRKLSQEAIDMFLDMRPSGEDEEGKTMAVDVTFFPGSATLGSNLHIGGEGAGSRDAKFTVKLSQKVAELAKQAAKYWGLDPEKVFFLDRDKRIVPDSMVLSDIILPPLPPEEAAANAISDGGLDTIDEYALAVRPDGPRRMEAYTVKGRNYSLTLVRATTVLDQEDLNKPKGEEWNDFTFNANQLNQELEATRKKRGDDDLGAAKVESLDAIPSLYELIKLGLEKKAKKRADTRCRWAEFVVFILCKVLFYWLIILPDVQWTMSMHLTTQNADVLLSNFTNGEKAEFQLPETLNSFSDITTREQYAQWLQGPFRKSMLGQTFQDENLFIIGIVGYLYKAKVLDLQGVNFCASGAELWADYLACLNASNVSVSNISNDTNASNCSFDSNASAGRRLIEPLSLSGRCVPREFMACSNEYTVEVFQAAEAAGDITPRCEGVYRAHDTETFATSWMNDAFSYANGDIKLYSGGTRVEFGNLSFFNDSAHFNASLSSFQPEIQLDNVPAKMLAIFIYNPTLNGLIVERMLVEYMMSGGVTTKTSSDVISLHGKLASIDVGYCGAFLCSVICFLMEVRRILGWPKSWSPEEERDRCGLSTLFFFLLPCALLLSYVFYKIRCIETANVLFTKYTFLEQTQQLFIMQTFDKWVLGLNLLVLVLFNALFFRYLLLFFPQLIFLNSMVKKVSRPLLVAFGVIFAFLFCLGLAFFTLYSSRHYDMKNFTFSGISTLRFALGGLSNWPQLWKLHPHSFAVLMTICFVCLTIILNNLAISIMLSFKKEKDLFENYSYHTFWASERGKVSDPRDFNPATVGEDFSGKEPKRIL
jgi:hypothetical protein